MCSCFMNTSFGDGSTLILQAELNIPDFVGEARIEGRVEGTLEDRGSSDGGRATSFGDGAGPVDEGAVYGCVLRDFFFW